VDAPQVLFENEPYAGSIGVRTYDVARDGRFVMIENEPTDHTTQASIVVIRNWQETLGAHEKR
jgi:hypothetical protein